MKIKKDTYDIIFIIGGILIVGLETSTLGVIVGTILLLIGFRVIKI